MRGISGNLLGFLKMRFGDSYSDKLSFWVYRKVSAFVPATVDQRAVDEERKRTKDKSFAYLNIDGGKVGSVSSNGKD